MPHSARVFVIAGGNADGPGSYWMKLLNAKNSELVSSWHIVTRLTDAMAREWAAAAAAARPVYVVLFSDGSISAVTDPRTVRHASELAPSDFSRFTGLRPGLICVRCLCRARPALRTGRTT